jgi:predicted nucleic acid-binding protein
MNHIVQVIVECILIKCVELVEADAVVSGDKGFLAVKSYNGIRVLTPRAYLEEFAGLL